MDFNFSQFEILTGTGALFLCLFFISVFSEAPGIEAELGTEAAQVVEEQNLFWASVEAQGQRILLTGAAPDHSAKVRAGAVVGEVWGVTSVVNQIGIIGEVGTCQAEFDEYLDDQPVTFKTGRSDIHSSSYHVLGLLASIARNCDAKIEIAAHTDSKGEAKVNLQLSQRRADAVAKYLVSSGVDPESIEATGYGESQPLADNRSSKGRQKNRRVEFRVIGDAV